MSSGIEEMIRGCTIQNAFHKIYAAKFIYNGEIAAWPGVAINYTWVRSSKLAHFAHLHWPTSTIPDAMRCWTGSGKRPKANRPARGAGKCRKWLLPAEAPARSRGWLQYYGRYYRSALYPTMRELDRDLAFWAKRKYKKLRHHLRRATHWIDSISRRSPELFAHWQMGSVAP